MKNPSFQGQTIGTRQKFGHRLTKDRRPKSQTQTQAKMAAAQALKQVHGR
jgi:hypothetical protein